MALIKLCIAYDGTFYHGWQRQSLLPTVQGKIEDALKRLTQDAIVLHGAGRTDAGVHALAQVAHFISDRHFKDEDWRRGLNALLPSDIVVKNAEAVDETFHARFSAKEKEYQYRIRNAPLRSPFDWRTTWLVKQNLDLERMSIAAEKLTGAHDFTSFCAAGSEVKNHMVDLKQIQIEKQQESILITLTAPRFLQYMVRNVVGFLVEVGRGKRLSREILEVLEAKNRTAAGPTAPPHGLFLIRVDY